MTRLLIAAVLAAALALLLGVWLGREERATAHLDRDAPSMEAGW